MDDGDALKILQINDIYMSNYMASYGTNLNLTN